MIIGFRSWWRNEWATAVLFPIELFYEFGNANALKSESKRFPLNLSQMEFDLAMSELLYSSAIESNCTHYDTETKISGSDQCNAWISCMKFFILNLYILWFLVMAVIQGGWEYVKIVNFLKHNGVWFLLQIFDGGAMVTFCDFLWWLPSKMVTKVSSIAKIPTSLWWITWACDTLILLVNIVQVTVSWHPGVVREPW